MPTLAPPEPTTLDPDTIAEIEHALGDVRPCEYQGEDTDCPVPATWLLRGSCGCNGHYCDDHHQALSAFREALQLLCHLAVSRCRRCPKCANPICLGGDRWCRL
jgi:hypothetical protein